MNLSHARRWLRGLVRRLFGHTAPISAGRRPTSLLLETLEDRVVPTNLVTLLTPDSATTAGTLRYALANTATLGNAITFASSLSGDTITLSSSLTLGNSVTITGLGASATKISGNSAVEVFDVPSEFLPAFPA